MMAIIGIFHFLSSFFIGSSYSSRSLVGILIGIAVDVEISLERVTIFKITHCLLHKHGTHINILTFALISLDNIL